MMRVRQFQKTTNSLQAACSIRSSKETNQKMHAVFLSEGRRGLFLYMCVCVAIYVYGNKGQSDGKDILY